MRVELVGLDAGVPDCEKDLSDVPVRIGRRDGMDVRVTDPWASRLHCEIEQVGDTVWVRDLDSKHGVFVNGSRVSSEKLMPGDSLTIGITSYRINYERQMQASASPARLATHRGRADAATPTESGIAAT